MCHLILLFPVVGLLLFWVMPFYSALPLYLIILILCGFIYLKIINVMHKQPKSGAESMIGQKVTVLKTKGNFSRVIYEGETWEAYSDVIFRIGEQAEILKVNDLNLQIGKIDR